MGAQQSSGLVAFGGASADMLGKTIIVIIMLLCSVLVAAATGSQTAPKSDVAARKLPNETFSDTQREAELLQAQLSTMKEYESQLLSTVHWTLTAVVAIVVLVAGFGWYSNSRVYEKDKESLRQYCESLIQAQTITTEKRLQEQLTTFAQANEQFRNDSHEEIATRFGKLSDDIKTLVRQVSASSATQMSDLESKLKHFRCDFLDFMAEAKERDGDKQSAVTTNIAFLSAAKEVDNPYAIMRAIQAIVRLLKGGQTLFNSDLPGLLTLLDGLPPECGLDVRNLRDVLERVRS